MWMHPDVMLALANDRHRELVADSDKQHLLTIAREARQARKTAAARARPTGTLASCEPSAAVPAR